MASSPSSPASPVPASPSSASAWPPATWPAPPCPLPPAPLLPCPPSPPPPVSPSPPLSWPDGAPVTVQPGQVLWCEGESSHLLNLERARQWGLDLSNIVAPLDTPLYNFRLDNKQNKAILLLHAQQDSIRLVVLDSLSGLHSYGSLGRAAVTVRYLADVARISGKPVILTHHLRKRTPLDRDGRPTLE
ncbi:MAG: AAA family ATPase, partial [Chloroflexi bacterium]|nr:AAA family ATPase [Chloroflexota bacterium]